MTTFPDRGDKHVCMSCCTRFYDLKKSPAICPQCKKKVVVLAKPPRRSRRAIEDSIAEKKQAAPSQVVVTKPATKSKHVKWK